MGLIILLCQLVLSVLHSLQNQGIDILTVMGIVPVLIEVPGGFVVLIEGKQVDVFRFQKQAACQCERVNLPFQLAPLNQIIPIQAAVGREEIIKLRIRMRLCHVHNTMIHIVGYQIHILIGKGMHVFGSRHPIICADHMGRIIILSGIPVAVGIKIRGFLAGAGVIQNFQRIVQQNLLIQKVVDIVEGIVVIQVGRVFRVGTPCVLRREQEPGVQAVNHQFDVRVGIQRPPQILVQFRKDIGVK